MPMDDRGGAHASEAIHGSARIRCPEKFMPYFGYLCCWFSSKRSIV